MRIVDLASGGVAPYAVNPFSGGASEFLGELDLRWGGGFDFWFSRRWIGLFLAWVVAASLVLAEILVAHGVAQQHGQRSLALGRVQIVAERAAKRA